MNLPINNSFSLDRAYILCFYPALKHFSWIKTIQSDPSSSIISLLSMYKSPLSMDIFIVRNYLDYFLHWDVVFHSAEETDQLWLDTFMEKTLGIDYPLFQKQLTFTDLSLRQ